MRRTGVEGKNVKTTSAGARRNSDDDGVTLETVFNYWDLWSARVDYPRRGGMKWHCEGAECFWLRGCTLHRRAREKNDEGVYLRFNPYNVETDGLVRCLRIIQVIQY